MSEFDANFTLENNEPLKVDFSLKENETIKANFSVTENELIKANFKLTEQPLNATFTVSENEPMQTKFQVNVTPDKLSQLINDVGYITLAEVPEVDLSNYATKEELNQKQDIITDLATIRENALLAVTAIQPSDLATVATTGNYYDLTNIPTIPTMTSQLNNNSDFTTKAYVDGLVGNIETLLANINSGS